MKTIKILSILTFLFCRSILFAQVSDTEKTGNASLQIHYPESLPSDTIVLYSSTEKPVIFDKLLGSYREIKAAREAGGIFNFTFPVDQINKDQLNYIYVILLRKVPGKNDNATIFGGASDDFFELLPLFSVNPRDHIKLEVHERGKPASTLRNWQNYTFHFTGNGSAKYNLKFQVDSLSHRSTSSPIFNADLSYNQANDFNKKMNERLAYLEKFKTDMSDRDFNILKCHVLCTSRSEEAQGLYHWNRNLVSQMDSAGKARLIAAYDSATKINTIPLNILLASKEYYVAEYDKQEAMARVKYGATYMDSLYHVIKQAYTGAILDKMITIYLIKNGVKIRTLGANLSDALTYVRLPEALEVLNNLKRKTVGQQAFNFSLPDVNGHLVKLSDFKGKVVFMDFWFTGCLNCCYFYKNELSKIEQAYKNDKDVVFITVCVDKAKAHWVASINSGEYTSPEVINLYTGGLGDKSGLINYYQISSYPQPVIIGKNQEIFEFSIALRSAKGISDAIEKLKRL